MMENELESVNIYIQALAYYYFYFYCKNGRLKFHIICITQTK